MAFPKLTEEIFLNFLEKIEFRNTFWGSHYERYIQTFKAIERAFKDKKTQNKGLELGASWVFSTFLKEIGFFDTIDVTDFDENLLSSTDGIFTTEKYGHKFRTFSLDLESTALPVEDETYDFVLCCELIEHLDVDPMFMMSEINRVLTPGGILVLSTPNSIAANIVKRILHGYSPQFYMFYQKNRSPFRHNFEYAPHQIAQLIGASGLEIVELWTADSFAASDVETIAFLKENGFPSEHRGDNIFVIARKTGPVRDRYPDQIYDVHL